ncbi:MAG: hypothetical protein QM813_05195 [Verrucomicrobiota bacterium]
MSSNSQPNRDRFKPSFALLPTLALLVVLLVGRTASAQTLQLRYTFEDSGTTTTSDPGGALSVPLNILNFPGTAADLHGAVGSGVNGSGKALDFSSASNAVASNLSGPIAQVLGNPTLGTLGVVSNFTVAFWFKQDTTITNNQSRGGRFFLLATNGVTDQTGLTTNGVSVFYQNTNSIFLRMNSTIISLPVYYNPLPTNVWLFFAATYDGTNNCRLYFGSDVAPAKLASIRSFGPQIMDFGTGGGMLRCCSVTVRQIANGLSTV